MNNSSRIIRQTVSISAMILTATMLSGCLGADGDDPTIDPTSAPAVTSDGTTDSAATVSTSDTSTTTDGTTDSAATVSTSDPNTTTDGTTDGSTNTTIAGLAVKASANSGIVTGPALTSNVSASNNDATGEFTITVDNESVTFNSSDPNVCNFQSSTNEFICQKTVNNVTETLVSQKRKSSSGQTYLEWGEWSSEIAADSGAQRYIVLGNKTVNLPTSGTATYNGSAQVTTFSVVNNTLTADPEDYRGSSTLQADFGTGNVTATLDSFTKDINGTAANVSGSLGLTGSISGNDINFNSVSGTLDGNTFTSGSGQGAFFGPNAEAVGGVFEATGNNVGALGVFEGCKVGADCQ